MLKKYGEKEIPLFLLRKNNIQLPPISICHACNCAKMRLGKILVMEGIRIGKNAKIGNIVVQYGRTLVREVLNAGYSVSDFEQIIEEPTLATCNLREGGKTIAVLSFYHLKEKISIDKLCDVPIDLALLHSKKRNQK